MLTHTIIIILWKFFSILKQPYRHYKVHKCNFLNSESSTQVILHVFVCSMARVSWSPRLYLISSEPKANSLVSLQPGHNNIAINLPIKLDSFTLLQKEAAMIEEKEECTKQSFSNLCWFQLAHQIYGVFLKPPKFEQEEDRGCFALESLALYVSPPTGKHTIWACLLTPMQK